MRYLIKAAWALAFTAGVHAQPLQLDYKAINEKYKGNNAIILDRQQHLRIATDGKGNLKIESDHSQLTYYIDTRSTGIAERQVSYSPTFYTISSISANTYLPDDKGKYTRIPVRDFKDQGRVDNGSVFYDGVQYRKFQFASIKPGAITETRFTYQYKEPGHLGGFYFMWGIPHYRLKYSVTVSDDVGIAWSFFGDSSFIKTSVVKKGKNTVYTWEAEDVPALKSYSDAVNDRYYEPHMFVYITGYQTPKGWSTLFGTPADLYRYDYRYISKCNSGDAIPEMKTVVDSIKARTRNETELMRGIYYWVQNNMKYIAFEDGLGGQVPREANDVFTRRYGDCKDFASLITTMCKAAGIRSYLAWIGSRDLPYTYKQLPNGYSTNHMIAAASVDGKWVFIDGTSKHTAFGTPSGFTQGKEAMISIDPDSFVIETVPIMPATANESINTLYLTIDDKHTINGNVHLELNGYSRSYMVDALYYTGIDKVNDQLKKYMSVGNNKCEVTALSTNDYNNNDSAFIIDYTFTLPDYVRSIDDEMFVNMHLHKQHLNSRIDTAGKRIAAKDIEYAYSDKVVAVLKIPAGYKIKKLPPDSRSSEGKLLYSFTYEVKGDSIIFTSVNRYDHLSVEPEDFDSWNRQIEALARIYKETIILTRIKK